VKYCYILGKNNIVKLRVWLPMPIYFQQLFTPVRNHSNELICLLKHFLLLPSMLKADVRLNIFVENMICLDFFQDYLI